MPYQGGNQLSGETASKLGHIAVINSELVNRLVESFFEPNREIVSEEFKQKWLPYDKDPNPLNVIFAVDGSIQNLKNETAPGKEVCFVKTALVSLDKPRLESIDPKYPHPLALRDLLKGAGIFHATVFPLRNVTFKNESFYHGMRKMIFDSMKDPSLEGNIMETLKWIAYEKWTGKPQRSPEFECPHCQKMSSGLKFDLEIDSCEHCGEEVYLTDMLSFHLELSEEFDYAPQTVAASYMQVHETLLLLTGIRYIWEQGYHKVFENCLFIKDGPLSLRAQYVKLVDPIRNFLHFAREKGVIIYLIGQEKSGAFFDHLKYIQREIPNHHIFLPDFEYIRQEIQHNPDAEYKYGFKTNYGNKVFVKTNRDQFLVLNVPTGLFSDTEDENSLIGLRKILGTLESIQSYRHEGGLLPVELAHNIASLSNYPSARILKLFAQEKVMRHDSGTSNTFQRDSRTRD